MLLRREKYVDKPVVKKKRALGWQPDYLQKKPLFLDDKGEKGKENVVECILGASLRGRGRQWPKTGSKELEEINLMQIFQVKLWALCAVRYLSVIIMNSQQEFLQNHYTITVNGFFVEASEGIYLHQDWYQAAKDKSPRRKTHFLSQPEKELGFREVK